MMEDLFLAYVVVAIVTALVDARLLKNYPLSILPPGSALVLTGLYRVVYDQLYEKRR